MESSTNTFTAKLRGIRPILFDRYGGDNKTKLPNIEKMYLTKSGQCGIPVLNMFSMLAAQNTPSVAKRFYGKQGRDVALGVMSFLNIESLDEDPMICLIRDAEGVVYNKDDKRISVIDHVARLKDGVPNPKSRPMIPTGWNVSVKIELQRNALINEQVLRTMFEQGGILGLGTFRPIFGRYAVEWT